MRIVTRAFAVIVAFAVHADAQQITQIVLSRSVVCAGDTITVSVTTIGTFASDNVFVAQLSNAAGSFLNPVTIGRLTARTGGAFVCTIPQGLGAATGYRVRVLASDPLTVGDSTAPVEIHGPGQPYVYIDRYAMKQVMQTGDSIRPIAYAAPGGSWLWTLGEGAVPPTSTQQSGFWVWYTTAGLKKITLAVSFDVNCGSTPSVLQDSTFVNVVSCNPRVPDSLTQVNTDGTLPRPGRYWIRPGVTGTSAGHSTLLVDAAATVTAGVSDTVFVMAAGYAVADACRGDLVYVAEGGSLVGRCNGNENTGAIALAAGASFTGFGDTLAVRCPTLTFDNLPNKNAVVEPLSPTDGSVAAYPNPFSDRTSLAFTTTTRDHVRLTVCDMLGRLLATPVDAVLEQGAHVLPWSAEGISNGMMMYRIVTSAGTHSGLLRRVTH